MDGGGGGLLSDTTGVLSVLETDVPLLSPVLTPGVTDRPKLFGGGNVIADELDAVVEVDVLGALSGSHHTVVVVLPSGSINADGGRSNRVSVVQQSLFITTLSQLCKELVSEFSNQKNYELKNTYVFESSDVSGDLVLDEAALAICSFVRVVLLCLNSSGVDDVLESSRSVTSVTTSIKSITVNTKCKFRTLVESGKRTFVVGREESWWRW